MQCVFAHACVSSCMRVFVCVRVCNSEIFYLCDNDATNRHMPRYSYPLKAPLVFWWLAQAYKRLGGDLDLCICVCMQIHMCMC